MKHTAWRAAFGLAALLILSQAATAVQFKHAVYYKAGSRPYQVVTAELTSSGNEDLVVADYVGGHVSVLLGNGDGTFQPPLKFAVPAALAVAVGDLNEDGHPDLAIVESAGNSVGRLRIFLGDGRGKFHAGASYRLGIQPISAAIADFNGDGHLDVAVANEGFDKPGNVMVFFGTGKGTLEKHLTYKVAGGPYAIAVGDLNGDRHPDLALTQFTTGSVAVLINDGTGKFLKPVTYNAGGGEVVDLKIADLRNNGKQDLVVANASDGMVVLLNKGDGTFGKPTVYVPTCHNCQGPEACVAADFNLDGNLDVACATSIDDSYFFYGDGTGKFGSAIPIKDTINFQGGFSIAAGDFNKDKAPDLAIPIELKGKVAIMLNTQ